MELVRNTGEAEVKLRKHESPPHTHTKPRTPRVASATVVTHSLTAVRVAEYGTNPDIFDRADFLKVERPLTFAGAVVDKHFHGAVWQQMMPRNCGKGEYEMRWLCRHTVAQLATASKRQMRTNQIPRRMLQQLQAEHHRRRQAQGGGQDQGGAAAMMGGPPQEQQHQMLNQVCATTARLNIHFP